MTTVKCIEKIRDEKGKIVECILTDNNRTYKIDSATLKEMIKSERVNVTNLRLTINNRLIDKVENKESIQDENAVYIDRDFIRRFNTKRSIYFKSNVNISTLKSKVAMIGSKLSNPLANIYILENDSSIGVISDKQLTLKTNCKRLFADTDFKSIDLRGLNSSYVKNMTEMFEKARAESINLSTMNTSNVEKMKDMFKYTRVEKLDLSSFNTSKVTTMEGMFHSCFARQINISSFDTINVTEMSRMFYDSNVEQLNLKHFNTSKVGNMWGMFRKCKVKELDLSSFRTPVLTTTESMFEKCLATKIDISNFTFTKCKFMASMFAYSEAEELDLRNFSTIEKCYCESMFYGCKAKEINLSNCNFSRSVTTNMFIKCNAKLIATDARLLKEYKERESDFWKYK